VSAADEYRKKAAVMAAMAKRQESPKRRALFAGLELGYRRLAELAEKNAATDIVYQTPAPPRAARRSAATAASAQDEKARKLGRAIRC
jgi:hypothetical protein